MNRKFDTVEEQREGLLAVADNIAGFWREIAEQSALGVGSLAVPADSDAGTLRLIASKLGG